MYHRVFDRNTELGQSTLRLHNQNRALQAENLKLRRCGQYKLSGAPLTLLRSQLLWLEWGVLSDTNRGNFGGGLRRADPTREPVSYRVLGRRAQFENPPP